jgi:hypothetical protein
MLPGTPALPAAGKSGTMEVNKGETREHVAIIATCDYIASDHSELSFNRGDQFIVVDANPPNANGWMVAHMVGKPTKKGLVPRTFF